MASSEQGPPPRRGFSVLGPAILIGLGIIFLLNSLDIVPWSVWGTLWRFWPVILILIGVEIVLGRTGVGRGVSLAVGIVLVVLLVGLAVAASQAGWASMGLEVGQAQRGSVDKDLERLQEVRADVEFGAGKLELDSLPAGSDKLVVVDYTVGGLGRSPRVRLEEEGRRGILRITGREGWRVDPRAEPDRWNIHLSRSIPLDLTVRMGAADGSLDLEDLKVRTLNLDVGASSVVVRFPAEAGSTRAFVNAGAASLTLEIPSNVGARIVADSGLAFIDASSRFSRAGGVYTTTDYPAAANRLELELKAGVSSVSIR